MSNMNDSKTTVPFPQNGSMINCEGMPEYEMNPRCKGCPSLETGECCEICDLPPNGGI